MHAGFDERVDDVPALSSEGAVQVVQNGANYVLWRAVAGVDGCLVLDFCVGEWR